MSTDKVNNSVVPAQGRGDTPLPENLAEPKQSEKAGKTRNGFSVGAVTEDVRPKTPTVPDSAESRFNRAHQGTPSLPAQLDSVSDSEDEDEFSDAEAYQPWADDIKPHDFTGEVSADALITDHSEKQYASNNLHSYSPVPDQPDYDSDDDELEFFDARSDVSLTDEVETRDRSDALAGGPVTAKTSTTEDGDVQEQPVDQPGFFGRLWSGAVHGAGRLAQWAGRLVEAVKDNAVKPVINKVVEKREAIKEAAQYVENKTHAGEAIYRVVASYITGTDLGKQPIVTVPNKSQALDATARLLNVLTVGFSAKKGMLDAAGRLGHVMSAGTLPMEDFWACEEDSIRLDEVIVGDAAFRDVQAHIRRLENGHIVISDLSFRLVPHKGDQPLASTGEGVAVTPDLYESVDMKLENVEIACPLTSDKEKQVKAVAAAVTMQPEVAAGLICEAFCPELATISIAKVEGITRGRWLEGGTADEAYFRLEDTSLKLHINKDFYPGLTPEVTVTPGNIKAGIKSDSFISKANAKIHIDEKRSGEIETKTTIDLSKISWLLKPFGKVKVRFKSRIENGVSPLDGFHNKIDVSIGNRLVRFLVKTVLKNTLKSRFSGLTVKDGQNALKLQLSLLSEGGTFGRFPKFVRFVNGLLGSHPIEIPIPLCGLRPMEKGKKGLGYVVIGDMSRGILPCASSLYCKRHEDLLAEAEQSLRAPKLNGTDDPVLVAAEKIMAEAEDERKRYNFSAEESLYRRMPLPVMMTYVNHVKEKPEDLANRKRLVRLMATLTDVMPNKALQLIKATSASEKFPFADLSLEQLKDGAFTLPTEQYFLISLIMTELRKPEPVDARTEELEEFHRQTTLLRDVFYRWNTAQKSRDGSAQDLTRPDTTPEAGKALFETVADKIKGQQALIAPLLPAPISAAMIAAVGAQQLQALERPKTNSEKFAEGINNSEELYQDRRRNEQAEAKGWTAQAMKYAVDFAEAVLPRPLEARTLENELSRRMLEQDLALAGMKMEKVIAGSACDSWMDSRYWRVVGAMCNSGHCSTHEAAMAVMKQGRAPFHSRLAYLSNLLELTAGGYDLDKAVRSFFMEAPQSLLQEMVDYYTQKSGHQFADLKTFEAYGNLMRLAKASMGEQRQQVISEMVENNTSWLLRDMIRPCHRMQENRACWEIMKQVEKIQGDAQTFAMGKTGEEGKEIAAWCDEQCQALLSILPLERMSEQLSRAKSVGDNMSHSHANKYFMAPFQREDLENILCKAYGMVAKYSPEKVVPGVLDRQHENRLLCDLSHQAKDNEQVRELLQTHLLCRVILDKTGRMMKPGEVVSFEDYMKGIVGVLAGYTNMITSLPLGGPLLLKAVGAGYAASFGRDASDSRYSWADQLSSVLSAGKNRIWSLVTGDQGPESFEAAVAEIYQETKGIPEELENYPLDRAPLLPAFSEQALKMSLTNQDMIDMLRSAFPVGDEGLSKDQLLRLITPYSGDDKKEAIQNLSLEASHELQEAINDQEIDVSGSFEKASTGRSVQIPDDVSEIVGWLEQQAAAAAA